MSNNDINITIATNAEEAELLELLRTVISTGPSAAASIGWRVTGSAAALAGQLALHDRFPRRGESADVRARRRAVLLAKAASAVSIREAVRSMLKDEQPSRIVGDGEELIKLPPITPLPQGGRGIAASDEEIDATMKDLGFTEADVEALRAEIAS